MSDTTLRDLPLLAPPRSAWPQLQAQLQPRRSPAPRHALFAFAAAAALVCALLLPRWTAVPEAPPAAATAQPVAADAAAELAALQRESAQLETLIAYSRNDAVTVGSLDTLSNGLQQRVAAIDGLLARSELDPEAALPLWQERVLRLRQWADLETTQQLLAANGDADPGAPVLAF
jgi:hypothetical protein